MAKYLSLLMSFLIMIFSSQNIFSVAKEFKISKPAPGVMVIHDENGNFGGNTMGLTHQVSPEEEIKKTIDLSELSDDVLKNAKQARVCIYFGLVDWSHNTGPKIENGLDEEFEIVVNGHSHVYKTNEGFPTRESKQSPIPFDWTDFIIPVSELIKGRNKIIVRKTKSEKFDDYIYVGIDNTVEYGHSACKLPGGYWQRKELNNVKAQGEYMIRLVLLEKELRRSAEWEKGKISSDPEKLIGFVEEKPSELIFQIDPERIDKNSRITTKVKVADPDNVILKWFDANNNEISGLKNEVKKDLIISSLERLIRLPNELVIFTKGKVEDITSVTIDYSIPYIPKPWINMCPRISEAKGSLKEKSLYCNVGKEIIELGNAYYSVRFSIKPKLRMESFFVNYLSKNILQSPETRIFLLETEGKGLGADDFIVREVKKESSSKVELVLLSDEKLEAKLTLSVDESPEFRMGLTITNRADSEKEFKIAFPHLAGICLSDNLDNDYYLFPYKGGLISPLYSEFRTAYGENTCWWQMIDIFSPTGGAGVYLRSDDTTGLYKVPVLLKSKPGKLLTPGETSIGRYMDPDMLWEKSLKSGDGIAMTFEFLKMKRAAGQSFSPPDSVIGIHEGDWHEAMNIYSKWAHKVWKWRPYPSKLTDRWYIQAVGIGHLPLFRDGKYRSKELDSEAGIVETSAWWEWSSAGPWGMKLDDNVFEKIKADGSFAVWSFLKDPATGELKYNMNKGDLPPFQTYNKAWGGLPALREYIQRLKEHDKLTTLYYDGFSADDTTEVGQKYGKKYGVMNSYWTNRPLTPDKAKGYVDLYGVWNMCIDTEFWQDYVAKGLKQVMIDTGADGVRLDEIGHQGYTCFNPNHKHIFAEPGHNAWLQAASLLCKKVHQAMDEVNPQSILMTEFPGTDCMASNLDGCISYETQDNKIQARPVLVDLFNFYFKECKIYDLNYNPNVSPKYSKWNVFNGKAFFSCGYYQYDMFYIRILEENSDVFSSPQREALIPTLIEGVYANRWIGKDKTIITFINAKPYTVEGEVIEVPQKEGYHYFDFLSTKEVKSDGNTIFLNLSKGEVACVVCLPDVLDVQTEGKVLKVTLKLKDPSGYKIVVSDKEAARLVGKEAVSNLQFNLSGIKGNPACVKLFKGKYLVDAKVIPVEVVRELEKEKTANQKERCLSKALRNNKNGHLYLRVDKEIDWNAATKECKSIGGYLVTITSADEQDWIFNNLGRELLAEHWMGGTDSEREGEWRWVTNELFSYTNWAQSEPNNVENEDHMSFHWTSDGKWNDSQGEAKKKGYICEWEPKK